MSARLAARSPVSILEAARARAGGSPGGQAAWERAAAAVGSLPLETADALYLIRNAPDAPTLISLVTWLSRSGPDGRAMPDLGRLRQQVGDSAHPPADWLTAIHRVAEWARSHGQVARFEATVGYVECSSDGAHLQGLQEPLPTTVGRMLEQFGFSGD